MDRPSRGIGITAALLAALLVAGFAPTRGNDGPTNAVGAVPPRDSNVYAWTAGKLGRVDPVTLRLRGRTIRADHGPTAFSPDRQRLAVAGAIEPSVRIVDLRKMRLVGSAIQLGPMVAVDTMQWLDASTLAVVTWGDPQRLLLVDVAGRRVTERRDLPGHVFGRARTRDALVLLIGPSDRLGESSLVVVDGARGLRTVPLGEVRSGFAPVGGDSSGDHRQIAPGLAIDPTGRRVVVVPPSGRVAEVDLPSLAVTYHELTRAASFFGRLRDWLEPPAHAKSLAGPERHAFWVGYSAVVAVVAVEQTGIRKKGGEHRQLARAAGVQLIDTGNWSVRTLADRAGSVAVTAATVLAYGGPFGAGGSFSSAGGRPVTALRGFATNGRERFRFFPTRHVGHVEAAGRYAYATNAGRGSIDVVDVVAGRVVRTVRTQEHVFIVAP